MAKVTPLPASRGVDWERFRTDDEYASRIELRERGFVGRDPKTGLWFPAGWGARGKLVRFPTPR